MTLIVMDVDFTICIHVQIPLSPPLFNQSLNLIILVMTTMPLSLMTLMMIMTRMTSRHHAFYHDSFQLEGTFLRTKKRHAIIVNLNVCVCVCVCVCWGG